ncbi:hypothetical protein [Actinomadura sp. NPDC049753]|uniref:hypothetical protein n=1 Tax=Actinomadura sp. NPDC049753 TaxID=3154739 RepID=UPI00343C647F
MDGTVRVGRIDMADGVTKSSAFRFTVVGALTGATGTGVPSTGTVTVWEPVSQAQSPAPGRYVLLLDRAVRSSTSGEPLFEMAPQPQLVLPLGDDGRLTLRCQDGTTGVVQRERLRTELDGS